MGVVYARLVGNHKDVDISVYDVGMFYLDKFFLHVDIVYLLVNL